MSTNDNGVPDSGHWVPPPRGYALSGKIMLTAIVVLFTAVLLILFLHLYLRWRVLRRTSSGRRRRRRLVFVGEDWSFPSPVDRGLAADVLKSLPVFVFSVRGGGGGGGDGDEVVECAVCLAEFQEGEKVRSLPRCAHRFHIECIDMWFRSHSSCPLCRTTVEAAPPPVNSTISVQVSASEPPPPRFTSASDMCSGGGREEGIEPSSANLGGTELRIDVPARRGEGFRGSEEELGLGWGVGSPGGQGMKSPGSRILLLRRLLSRDLKLYRGGSSGAAPDLERGEGAERSSPPPPPPPPPPPAAGV